MQAVFDIGSNTVRMLMGSCISGQLYAHHYERRITRLAGGISASGELAEASVERTCNALAELCEIARRRDVAAQQAVATAALREARNRDIVLNRLRRNSGLPIRVISGFEEGALTARGVLTVLNPLPAHNLIVDIGGGSTEFILTSAHRLLLQRSYPLGVVRLCEQYAASPEREQKAIQDVVHDLQVSLEQEHSEAGGFQLAATAGTATTLAAMHLGLNEYRAALINNHSIPVSWLEQAGMRLSALTVAEREELPGMEPGRGDLILPGIRFLLQLMHAFRQPSLKISDAGLLEGLLCASVRE